VPRWNADQDAAVDEAIGRAADGIPTVLLVEGGAGTGKSAFLRRVAASAQGFCVFQLQADRDWQEPYAALAEWDVLGAPADPGLSSLQAARALRSWIERTRAGASVLIVIDDLDHLDAESSDMFIRLIERTFRDRILVAATASRLDLESLRPWNRLLGDADRGVHVKLAGLEETAAAELVSAAWPGADDALTRQLWAHTAGNPLFLRAILREYTLEEVRDDVDLPAPRDLVRALATRLERLDAGGARLLRAVVILGDRWTLLRTAGTLAALDDPADAARRLVSEGLLVSRGQRDRAEVRAANGVTGTAIANAMAPAERRALHLRAAPLADSPADALRHRFLAAGGYDEDLAGELEAAAWSLHLARQTRKASQVGLWASEVSEDPAARERRLLDALFDAVLARDLGTAERRLPSGDAHDQAQRKLVEGFTHVGRRHWAAAAAVFWSIPASQIQATDGRTRFRLRVLRAWTQIVTGGSPGRARHELVLARDANATADPHLSGYYGFASAVAGNIGVTGSPARLPDGLEINEVWQGSAAAIGGMPDIAVRNLKPVVARIDDGLLTMGEGEFHAMLGYAYWLRGDWPQARELVRASLQARYGRANPMVRAVSMLAGLDGGGPGTLAGQRDMVRAALRDAPWPHAISMAVTTEFVYLLLTGQQHAQAQYLGRLDADFGTLTWPGTMPPPLWLLTFGMINAAARQPDAVRDLAAQLARHHAPANWRGAGAAWLDGLAAELDGDLQAAARSLSQANARGMTGLAIHAALLSADLARVRHSLGDEGGAAGARRAAASLLANIDGAPNPVGPTADPLAALSDREREVALLLTQGLSYAQIAKELFISRSTVAFHLSNIYAKTATGSRHELTGLIRSSRA
jgi:DNA-binding CsgD family transcriptional regulator